jgi:acyl-CoA synthetase (AMP-forming)/AMP-acid ligase II
MHPAAIARHAPDRPAVIMARSGRRITFAELDAASNRLANLLRERRIQPGDSLAIFAGNDPSFLEVTWAAQRAGLYYTAINSHLTAVEAAYIADDCGAAVVVSTNALAPVAQEAFSVDATPKVRVRLVVGADLDGWERYETAVHAQPSTPIADEMEGDFLLYSSGTTGRPKGIKRPLTLAPLGQGPPGAVPFLQVLGLQDGDVYLCPAPLYHAAPLAWSMGTQRLGGTVVVMERFEPAEALALIEQHQVTHAQFVPTMFVRMLKLPEAERAKYDVSSLKAVVHAAAPCPVDVKQAMIDWWGPIISEYYSATEGIGATFITAAEWLTHKGSVGKAMLGVAHILDDAGKELPTGEIGTVWFSGGYDFDYHNDPRKTAEAKDGRGYSTVGDVGYLDEEGYLYLTDRKAFMIISGGVNIYPQEAENVLINHPQVLDVGVIGVPDPEMGEAVKAVVQPMRWEDAGPDLEAELIAYCREHLAAYKCPRSVDFDPELPRLDTGKLYKKQLRARYWPVAG